MHVQWSHDTCELYSVGLIKPLNPQASVYHFWLGGLQNICGASEERGDGTHLSDATTAESLPLFKSVLTVTNTAV